MPDKPAPKGLIPLSQRRRKSIKADELLIPDNQSTPGRRGEVYLTDRPGMQNLSASASVSDYLRRAPRTSASNWHASSLRLGLLVGLVALAISLLYSDLDRWPGWRDSIAIGLVVFVVTTLMALVLNPNSFFRRQIALIVGIGVLPTLSLFLNVVQREGRLGLNEFKIALDDAVDRPAAYWVAVVLLSTVFTMADLYLRTVIQGRTSE